MPSFTYEERQAEPELIPAGDYIFEVIEAVDAISKGAKTAGADVIELKVKIDGNGKTIYEKLIFAESTMFRVDCFVQSTKIAATKGQQLEIIAENLIGLRGWCSVKVETYNGNDRNRIARWLTDKPNENSTQEDPDW
jgi:hypothetical protein